MNLKALAAPFPESEIEWRISRSGKKGNGQIWATCLAYVSARAIMNRLDEVCGPENWSVEYRFVEGGVICNLGIKTEQGWIFKQDGSDASDIEPFKGGISGALKRAGSVWGVGRYLYGLDEGFARIEKDKVQGAQWAKTKDGAQFYWLPPNLPAWALLDPTTAKSNGAHPSQPGYQDGDQNAVLHWVYPVGRWQKRTREEVERLDGLQEMRLWVLKNEDKIEIARNKGSPLEKEALWLEAIEMTVNYIADRENSPAA